MAYTTTAKVKTYLDITDSGNDTLIGELISAAEQYINGETGRIFEAEEDTTAYYDAVRNVDGRLLIFDAPVAAITTVTNGDGVEVADSEYVTEPRGSTPYYGIRLLGSTGKAWTYTNDPENAISVEGRHAYTVTPDAECEVATRLLAAMMYNQRKNIGDVTRPLLTSGGGVVMPTTIPKQTSDFIHKYRKRY